METGGPNKPRFKKCSGCMRAHFCGKQCLVANWKKHKPDCRRATEQARVLREKINVGLLAYLYVCILFDKRALASPSCNL